MTYSYLSICFIIIALIMCVLVICYYSQAAESTSTLHHAVRLFPRSVSDIQKQTDAAIVQLRDGVKRIISIPKEKRTYNNTIGAFDRLNALSTSAILANIVQILEIVSPDADIAHAAQKSFLSLQQAHIDYISDNPALYYALKSYEAAHTEPLTPEQKYFLEDTLQTFRRNGLELSQEVRERVKILKKEIAHTCSEFQKNIISDQSHIILSYEDLAGLDESTIQNMKRNSDGKYIVGVDYPTYFAVQKQCINANTRKNLYRTFQQRAYPCNETVLCTLIEKRHELAQLLGFDTYAAYDLDDQMVQSIDRAHSFLDNLLSKIQTKTAQELSLLCADLPDSVCVSSQGRLQPWDMLFVIEAYKKKHFQLDDRKVAEYFPMDTTINGLLSIYESFFSLSFKKVSVSDLWHPDVQGLEVYEKGGTHPIGFLLLDLYPRPLKYSHACQAGVLPATYTPDNRISPAFAVVIANFPKPQHNVPSLLSLKDVCTFFHEFGHALHTILGRTSIASLAGTNVKRDFVEMPSQMLEEWLYDYNILTELSSHYKTGESLPSTMINAIIASQNIASGMHIEQQIFYARMALNFFEKPTDESLHTMMIHLFKDTISYMKCDQESHMYASFGHLTDYGAKYYGYLWSQVFALDLFHEVKKQGLLNPEIGKRYRNTVLAKGGSKDPNVLLKDFLGREPNQDAFLLSKGLKPS